jgi:putative heme iron utilization protein
MPRDHQRPAPDPDDPVPDATPARAPTHAERCRTLAAQSRAGTLCTIAREPAGFPYGSLVTVAFDGRGRPLLLLSELAEHTQNLAGSADASILLAEALDPARSPLALGRVTLLGRCTKVPAEERDDARRVFLAAQPDASYYVDFKDFAFHRLEPMALRYVGGFGRMSWVEAADYMSAEPDPLASASAGILQHMNDDHAEAVLAYARALLRHADATAATMTAVDRYGFDLTVTTPRGPRAGRLAFDAPVATSDEVRRAMVAMVKTARAAAGA